MKEIFYEFHCKLKLEPMKLTIQHQERYSRGELLLRTLFGWIYILIPHVFILMFVSLWGAILQFAAFWVILFTGRYPQSMFEFQVGLMKWSLRVNARMYNVSDGYPAFGSACVAGGFWTHLAGIFALFLSRGSSAHKHSQRGEVGGSLCGSDPLESCLRRV